MSTSHCRECGSEVCGHGNCPECNPCQHCFGGDRSNKFFEEEQRSDGRGDDAGNILEDEDYSPAPFPHTSDREESP